MNKNFQELWQQIASQKEVIELQNFNKKTKKIQKWILPSFVILCIFFAIAPLIAGIILPVFLVSFVLYSVIKHPERINKAYTPEEERIKDIGKEFVFKPIAQNFFENVTYSEDDKISEEEYRNGFRMFNELKKYFEANYLFQGQAILDNNIVSNFKMSEVEVMHGDGAGENDEQGEVISGDVIIMDLPVSINNNVILESKVNTESKKIFKYNSFDEIYDIVSKDVDKTQNIITDEMKQNILTLVNKYQCIFELSIINNKLYIRFNNIEALFFLFPDEVEAKKIYNGLSLISEISINVANMLIQRLEEIV